MSTTAATWMEAWNSREARAVAALLTPHATWQAPSLPAASQPEPVNVSVERLADLLGDYHFEVRSVLEVDQRCVVEWTLSGTNTGPPRPDIAATRALVSIGGVDVLECDAHGIVAARRFYDRQQLVEQLGLMALVQPVAQGPAVFGYSMRVASGNRSAPGVIALTWIAARDAGERERIRGHSRQIVQDFLQEPGFIGIVTGFTGERGFTVTAWEDETALERALARQHRVARRELMTQDFVPAVWTSVWRPLRINRIWTRCAACTALEDVSDDHRTCARCGATLPERPPFW